MAFLKPAPRAAHFHDMRDVFDSITCDGTQPGDAAERLAFSCGDWTCTGQSGIADAQASAEIQVTEVSIGPDNLYCFEVIAGGRSVAAFSFEDLASASAAAAAMRALAPAVSAVLLEMRTGKFKRDALELDGRYFW